MERSPADQILAMLGEVQGVLEREEFGHALMRAIRQEVPCDWISLNDIAPDPADSWAISEPALPAEEFERFAALAHENPLIARYRATHDARVYRFSDVVTVEQLHALAVYREFYGRHGIEHQLAFTLPGRRGYVCGVALSRCTHDFTEAERDLLERARPYLVQSYRNAQAVGELQEAIDERNGDAMLARLRAAGLTAREADIVRRAAHGASRQDIADALGLSVRTIDKHLERSFRTLGVHSRAEAAAVAWGIRGRSS